MIGSGVTKCNQPPASEVGKFTDVTLNCTFEEEISLYVDNTEDRFIILKVNISAGKGNCMKRILYII
jgi:hypothetical protein